MSTKITLDQCKKWIDNPYINPETGYAIDPLNKKGTARRLLQRTRQLDVSSPIVTYEQLKEENEFLKNELLSAQRMNAQLKKYTHELEDELEELQGLANIMTPMQ
jgi:hypothetical protein